MMRSLKMYKTLTIFRYTYCVTLAALFIGSTKALDYWFISLSMKRLTYVLCILFAISINLLGVKAS